MAEQKTLVKVGLAGLGGVCEAVHYPGFSRILPGSKSPPFATQMKVCASGVEMSGV